MPYLVSTPITTLYEPIIALGVSSYDVPYDVDFEELYVAVGDRWRAEKILLHCGVYMHDFVRLNMLKYGTLVKCIQYVLAEGGFRSPKEPPSATRRTMNTTKLPVRLHNLACNSDYLDLL